MQRASWRASRSTETISTAAQNPSVLRAQWRFGVVDTATFERFSRMRSVCSGAAEPSSHSVGAPGDFLGAVQLVICVSAALAQSSCARLVRHQHGARGCVATESELRDAPRR